MALAPSNTTALRCLADAECGVAEKVVDRQKFRKGTGLEIARLRGEDRIAEPFVASVEESRE